ncbi:NAD-dependent epimerase/dehydratase family protein [Streptomyces sp. YIM S03343]
MTTHVVIGAGAIGAATALLLAESGDQVTVVTRQGTGPDHPRIGKAAADATDPDRLARIAEGAATLFNCAAPPYHRWAEEFPPLAASLLTTAERTGAGLVLVGNLYGYGPVDRPMTEDLPLTATTVKGGVRSRMWQAALAAAQAGRVRVSEVRASDFIGPGAQSFFTVAVAPGVLAGRRVLVPADLDAPHSWTCTTDVARTLVAVSRGEGAWNRPWHVPSAPPLSVRELATRLARLHNRPVPRLRPLPGPLLSLAGVFSPQARELVELQYQFRRPFVLDSSSAEVAFGLAPTPVDQALLALHPLPREKRP